MVTRPRTMRNIKSMAMGSGDGRNPRAVGLRLKVFHPVLLIFPEARDSAAEVQTNVRQRWNLREVVDSGYTG